MAKDLPESGEGGAGPSAPHTPTKPVAPKDVTEKLQRLLDAADAKADEKERVVQFELGKDECLSFGLLRFPADVKIEGIVLATPEEHAKALNGVKEVERYARTASQSETFDLYHPQHAGAEALHGWKLHAHHAGQPIRLTRDAYENALRAAANPVTRVLEGFEGKGRAAAFKAGEPTDSHKAAALGVPTLTDYEPHAAALSPHLGKAL